MKTAAADLITLEGGVVRKPVELYHFWRGSSHWYLTSGDATVAWDDGNGSQSYTPAAISRGELSWNSNLEAGELQIQMQASLPVLADCLSGAAVAPAWVKVWKLLYDGSNVAWPSLLFVGQILNVTATGPDAAVKLVGLDYLLKREIPTRCWQAECPWAVFGVECTLDGDDWKITPTVTVSADGLTLTAAAFGAEADGWWCLGSVEVGNYKRMVVAHVGNDVTLDAVIPGLVTGNAVTAYPGCDGDVTTCRDKYDNVPNFGGAPYIPIDNPTLWVNK